MHPEQRSRLTHFSPCEVNNPLESGTGPKLGVAWGLLYGYLGEAPHEFTPELRKLGADATKINIFWSQVERDEGSFDWRAVDAFINQLTASDRALISVF